MKRVVLVQFARPLTNERIEQIQPALDVADDWLRFTNSSWLLWTTLGLKELQDHIDKKRKQGEKVLLLQIDDGSYWGRHDQALWDWLEAKGITPSS